jgi:cysteine desulfurase family protein
VKRAANNIYFDNAATSWPKPASMIEAMIQFNDSMGANPGRSGHRMSIDSGRIIFEARETIASIIGAKDPLGLAFTKNATEALNIAISGLLKFGDHCIISSMEHNSVMRPLRSLEAAGLELSIVKCSPGGEIDLDDITKAIRHNTRAVYITHASNVTGTIMPIEEIGKITTRHGIIFCVDAAQTLGTIPVDVERMNIDLLAFTGHKSLYGPQGTGGLFIRSGLETEISPLITGGTGSRSEFEQQPEFMPDKYESGTPNAIGISGLMAGARFVIDTGIEKIREKELGLTAMFLEGLEKTEGAVIYGNHSTDGRTSVVSFNLQGKSPSETALILDEKYGIMCRPGLHCAPAAHRTIGSFPTGTLRFSFGCMNTFDEIEYALKAINEICK